MQQVKNTLYLVEWIAEILIEWLPILVGMFISFRLALQGGGRVASLLFGWVAMIIVFLMFGVVSPWIVSGFDVYSARALRSFFPGTPEFVALLLFGWCFSGVALLVGIGTHRLRSGSSKRF